MAKSIIVDTVKISEYLTGSRCRPISHSRCGTFQIRRMPVWWPSQTKTQRSESTAKNAGWHLSRASVPFTNVE